MRAKGVEIWHTHGTLPGAEQKALPKVNIP
jgi:hypothetical protein